MQALQRSMQACSSNSSTASKRLTSSSSSSRQLVQQTRRPAVTAAAQQQAYSQDISGAAALSATVAAAVVLQACLPVSQAVAAAALPVQQQGSSSSIQQLQQQTEAAAWQPVLGDVSLTAAAAPPLEAEEEDMTLQDIEADIMSDVALPPELKNFMEMMQKGPIKSAKKLSEARRSVGFDRSVDGRVMLFSEDGEPFQVKNDMGVAGALLLRDAGGYMYYIPSAESDSLIQIDLSDDAVVAQLFANHAWEELVEPLEVLSTEGIQNSRQGPEGQQPAGHLEQLRLTEREFRSVVSLLSGSQELPEEPLDDLASQEGTGPLNY